MNSLNSIEMLDKYNNSDWWEALSDSEKKNIEAGIKDVEEGRTISSEEFWKRFDTINLINSQ